MKASEIMAEKLPGLVDPNLPPDQQPFNDTSNPNPAARPPQPLHPDEFSPAPRQLPSPERGAESAPATALPEARRAALPVRQRRRASAAQRKSRRNDAAEEPIGARARDAVIWSVACMVNFTVVPMLRSTPLTRSRG